MNLSYSVAYVRSQRERRKKGDLVDVEKSRNRNERYLQVYIQAHFVQV